MIKCAYLKEYQEWKQLPRLSNQLGHLSWGYVEDLTQFRCWSETDVLAWKHKYQTGLDTLLVYAVNYVYLFLKGVTFL